MLGHAIQLSYPDTIQIVHRHISVYTYILCVHTHVCVYTHNCVCIYTRVCTYVFCVCVHLYVCTCVFMCIHVSMCVRGLPAPALTEKTAPYELCELLPKLQVRLNPYLIFIYVSL